MKKQNDGDHEEKSSSTPVQNSDENSIMKIVPSKTQRISDLKSRVQSKTKEFLRIDSSNGSDDPESEEERPLKDIDRDPAFNPSQLSKKADTGSNSTAEKTKAVVKTISNTLAHPRNAAKSTITRSTAGQLSKAERPYLSQRADLDFLAAHDNLKRVESGSSLRHGVSDEEQDEIIDKHKIKIREMEAQRESLRVAWTTNRHLKRVRVVPKRHINFPESEYFTQRDAREGLVRFDWLKWLGYILIYYTQDFCAQYIDDFDELPFSVDSLRHHIERLIMASKPWQSWAMEVRSVYRWEDPMKTAEWFALYVFPWYTNHLVGFLFLYVIYVVLKNRFYPTSVESLRSSMQRAQDSKSKAYQFSELIDKHGRSDWLEPLLSDLGPYIQLQLGDMANMLEVFYNFYHWKSPRKTMATLFFFASCLLITVFADMDFCMKIVYFVAGGSFFLCYPIANRFPKYRYLVSPLKWVLWDIPTNAEWSFQYLRRKGQEARERMIYDKVESRVTAQSPANTDTSHLQEAPEIRVERETTDLESKYDSDESGYFSASSSASILDSSDIRSFRAINDRVVGRFVIFSGGVRFVRSFKQKELWRYDFVDLVEMRKIQGKKISVLPSSRFKMELICLDGSRINLEGMKERDEAFNSVIAFSSLQWQSLQLVDDHPIEET